MAKRSRLKLREINYNAFLQDMKNAYGDEFDINEISNGEHSFHDFIDFLNDFQIYEDFKKWKENKDYEFIPEAVRKKITNPLTK